MERSWASRIAFVIAGFVAAFVPMACGNGGGKQVHNAPLEPQDTKEVMATINRYLSEKDQLIIEGYAKRHKLSLSLSESGFYYHIPEKGKGKQAKSGSHVELAGSIGLIDGTTCYTYSPSEPKLMVVEKSGDISGLHMAVPMLREGGKAIFIFPPHLAYGLLGDGDKIPARSILVLNVELLKVED